MADALSEVLRAVRLSGGIFLDAEFTAPWCIRSQIDADDCRAFAIAPERVISAHYVLEGTVRVAVEGEPELQLTGGDLVLLARNDPHRIGSDLAHPAIPATPLIEPAADGRVATIRHGGGGARTRMICGYLASDLPDNPVSASLPRVFALRSGEGSAREWLESSYRFAAAELAAGRPGSELVLAKLSELLFIEAVRACIAALPADRTGWLAGLRDPQVGRALALLHEHVAHDWTVEELARRTGVSRSVLADRFASLLGEPPMRYLTRWRMQLAEQRLLESGDPLARIAAEVGYDSEAAFNRAFKRERGVPPARWRKRAR